MQILARAYSALGEGGKARVAFDELCHRLPDDADVALRYGRLLLREDDEAGVAHVERAMRLDPDWTPLAAELLIEFHGRRGDRAGVVAAMTAFEHWHDDRARYEQRIKTVTRHELLSPNTLGPDELERLVELFRADRRIKRAWIVAREETERGDRPQVIILAIAVPFMGHHAPSFRANVIDEYTRRISFLSEPAALFHAGAKRWLDREVRRIPGARVYDKRRR